MVIVKVPATSANIGPGFDCMGLALNMYSELKIDKIDSNGIEIVVPDELKNILPTDGRNYVYIAMEKVFNIVEEKFSGYRIIIDNKIPLTRGLGSSSAAIVSGLAGANYLLGNQLSKDELLKLACDIEKHPDNVAPAIFGGFVVSVCDGDEVHYIKNDISKDLNFAALVPDFYFQTKKSRSVLPSYVPHRTAVYNLAHAAFTASAFISGDYSKLDEGIKDKLHQQFRLPHIKDGESIMDLCRQSGAQACYLSGAGPTIMALINGDSSNFEEKINSMLNNRFPNWTLNMLKADNTGVCVEEV